MVIASPWPTEGEYIYIYMYVSMSMGHGKGTLKAYLTNCVANCFRILRSVISLHSAPCYELSRVHHGCHSCPRPPINHYHCRQPWNEEQAAYVDANSLGGRLALISEAQKWEAKDPYITNHISRTLQNQNYQGVRTRSSCFVFSSNNGSNFTLDRHTSSDCG